MHVQVLHDRFIRVSVSSALGTLLHVPLEKSIITAMGKNVGASWSAEAATINLSPHPLVDVVLQSTAPHQHRILVSSVVDADSVVGLHQVSVDGRHLVSDVLCDMHSVVGAEAIAKHLISKNCCIPQLECPSPAVRAFAEPDECVANYQGMLVRTENARRRTDVRKSTVQTVGSAAFRLFQRFNTTSTSKITSAFPQHDLAYAQSVCLAVGFLANASNELRKSVRLAHTLQQLAVQAQTAVHLRHLAEQALGTAAAAALPAAPLSPIPPTSTESGKLKRGHLSILCEAGDVYHTPFVTLDAHTARLLADSGIETRAATPMYMAFDRQHNAILVADVCMQKAVVLGGGVTMCERSPAQQAAADMHYINVSTAYHHEMLGDRRQVLLNKTCASLCKPTAYASSIFNMLRFEHGPMLALLAHQDL